MSELIKIMLTQHVGVSGIPIVDVGNKVKAGQLIAKCSGLGANIHSSVNGKVIGMGDLAVDIIADDFQSDDFVKIKDTSTNLEAVKEAGVVGAGGAGFPAHVKFDVDLQGGSVIVNAAECEPGLAHNTKVLSENAECIFRGLGYIMEMTNAAKGYIAVKASNRDIMSVSERDEPLSRKITNDNIEITYLSDRYPAGDERVVVREVLGIELNPGQLPARVGVIVTNAETVKRVVEAIELRKPVITKDFTVAGRFIGTFRKKAVTYLDQPIGASIGKYIADCGGFLEPYGELVLGGPFMGKPGTVNSVVTKTMGGILAAMPFPEDNSKFGILACECGAQESRLREIVNRMGGTVTCELKCKRMVEINGRFRCEKPGACPGQAEAALRFKTNGAGAIMVGACED